jgi:hypothetical protein
MQYMTDCGANVSFPIGYEDRLIVLLVRVIVTALQFQLKEILCKWSPSTDWQWKKKLGDLYNAYPALSGGSRRWEQSVLLG